MTTSDDPGDCYYVDFDDSRVPASQRHKVDCKEHYLSDGPSKLSAVYDRFEKELEQSMDHFESDGAILALSERQQEPKIMRFDSKGETEVAVDWGGWAVNSSKGVEATADSMRIVFVSRICDAVTAHLQHRPNAGMNLSCGYRGDDSWGKFGILVVQTKGKAAAFFRELGDPTAVMITDIVSNPVLIGDQVFVGWARNTSTKPVLVLSSVDLDSQQYCEWTQAQPNAIDPPIPISLLHWKNMLLVAWSRDGLITTLAVDPLEWNASCGARGVKVGHVQPIAH